MCCITTTLSRQTNKNQKWVKKQKELKLFAEKKYQNFKSTSSEHLGFHFVMKSFSDAV
jgi:hypothetical protein